MSFVRGHRNQNAQGKRPTKPKRMTASKKEWVSTVNDLSLHKATPEELARRHDIHRSQNRAAAQWELREKAMRSRRKDQSATPPEVDRYRLNLIREVFSDHCKLQDVLARSDRAMAVVKDLFGDAPRRQTGFPSVTVAPDSISDPELPVLQRPQPRTKLSVLSQAMMDPQALNELEEEYTDTEQDLTTYNNRPNIMHRGGSQRHHGTEPKRTSPPQTPCNTGAPEDSSALNATAAIQHVRSRQTHLESDQSTLVTQVLNPVAQPPYPGQSKPTKLNKGSTSEGRLNGSGISSLTGNQSSLEMLQSMLGDVETELDALSHQESVFSEGLHRPSGLTGFSVALVSAIGRLARHIRQRDEESQKEAREKKRLEDVVKDQRCLIDALTAESMSLREESTTLQNRVMELEHRLDMVILAFGGLGTVEESELEHGSLTNCEADILDLEKDTLEPLPVPPAVLLTPPRQRDCQATAKGVPPSLPVQGSHATGSQEGMDNASSQSSFASLPCSLSLCPPSQNSILEQIAELTRQNSVIRTQLGQYHTGTSVTEGQMSDHVPEQQTVKPSQSDSHMVAHIDERLLELKRQSAEARNKLLDMIEHQRQCGNVQSSPSLSSIQPHHESAERRTNEEPRSVPEKDSCTLASGKDSRSAGGISTHSFTHTVENPRHKPPVEKPKGDGWFALSAHVK
ncbi:spindle and centriole-associated protein 1 isoform X2 [Denticeps clupeoides]|uniref:Spindle and centriole-associated protein 1 n=2 Tax=Denticeps clupeoides TaxID=299321 RepID=A0AAY4AUY4_9TELE|nr:spindle and centriole-associated protein 1 isoform X2 [Denticeps clupeoides]